MVDKEPGAIALPATRCPYGRVGQVLTTLLMVARREARLRRRASLTDRYRSLQPSFFRHAPPDVFRRRRWFRLVGVDSRRWLPAAVALERQGLYRCLPAVAATKIRAGEIGMAATAGAFSTYEQPVFRTLTEIADLPAHGRDKNESGTWSSGVARGRGVWFVLDEPRGVFT